jgi:hypothetical protein
LAGKNENITRALFGDDDSDMKKMLNNALKEARTMFNEASQILEKEGKYDEEHRVLNGVTAG